MTASCRLSFPILGPILRVLYHTASTASSRLFHQPSMAGPSVSKATEIEIPSGFRLYSENTSHILLSSDEAFLNPVQEFNRDLSVACIRIWSEDLNRMKEEKWKKAQWRKAQKGFQKSGLFFYINSWLFSNDFVVQQGLYRPQRMMRMCQSMNKSNPS